MSFFRAAARAAAEARGANPALPWGDSTPPPPSLVGSTAAGIPVTQNVAAGLSAVYGCVSLLSDSVSSLPVQLRNGPEWKGSTKLPLSPLLKQPYAEISRRDWWISFIWALALRGNFYGRRIERDDLGLPLQIKPIHNDAVQIHRDRATGKLIYRFYGEFIPLDEVFHIRYQTLPGEVIGLNPIQSLALTFGNAVAKERFVESFYLNSANPMGVITVPGYLDRVETRKMMRAWVSAHQGLNKANLPAILTDGAEFKPITISPVDAQLIEALQFSDSQICGRIFRVPPHMIGIPERVLGIRGIEQAERSFFANTLVGYLQIGMEALTAEHRPGVYVHFDTTARTRGSTLERAQAGALTMNSGVARADEIREWFDWDTLPDGDGQHSYMPINTQLLETAVETLKQAKQMTALGPVSTPTSSTASTGSGAQPRPGMATKPSSIPPRKSSPNGLSQTQGRMTVDEAIAVIEAAVDQQQRRSYAAALAVQLNGHGQEED